MDYLYIFQSSGILISFLLAGIFSEQWVNMKKIDNLDFNISYFVFFYQFLLNFLFSFFYNRFIDKNSNLKKFNKKLYFDKNMIISSFSIGFSLFLNLTSSQYLGYLINIIIGSSKLLSILIGSLIFKIDKPSTKEFVVAIILTHGIIFFQLSGV